ncbi:MAG: glycosyltransferase family 4 protein [Lachnospiraceae bacterium]|nr:glycosyltransferase family 4 protein [Lachnospiraceae bacterium]
MFGFLRRFKKKVNIEQSFVDSIQIKVDCSDEAVFEGYKANCNILKEKVNVVKDFTDSVARRFVYKPSKNCIDANQMLEVAYTLLCRDLDYVIVSSTLDDFPVVGASGLEDCIIYSADTCKSVKNITDGNQSYCGRLLRLPGYNATEENFNLNDAIANIELKNEFFLVQGNKEIPVYQPVNMSYNYKSDKKMVFVLPIFMAVGGVERNTVEIMRALQDKYDFCVITMERHAKGQGSLNYQLNGLCEANYDLRELVEFDDYFDALNRFKEMYKPDVVWLCNNSPWLETNMLKFREIFNQQTIVAQDVYDTKYGWIEYYDSEGIHTLDKYIAVNEKIKTVFMDKYGLSEEKISVIYSAIDDSRIRNTINKSWDRVSLCQKYGVNPDKKHIALIGRMTDQKNPLRYLDMINSVKEYHDEIEFLVVGDGALSEQVDERIASYNLENCVTRIKFVDSTPELFQILDGLVLTSVYEGLAIVSIEAMSIGVPVLSTDTGDLKLFIDKTNGGVIIDENISDRDNFVKWYENLDEYAENSKKYSMEILDFFSAVNIAKQYCELFDK